VAVCRLAPTSSGTWAMTTSILASSAENTGRATGPLRTSRRRQGSGSAAASGRRTRGVRELRQPPRQPEFWGKRSKELSGMRWPSEQRPYTRSDPA
jgi:hypothetical protein